MIRSDFKLIKTGLTEYCDSILVRDSRRTQSHRHRDAAIESYNQHPHGLRQCGRYRRTLVVKL
jgi:hypothetical protein